ncbi:MAG: winged helix-turn-helix transcriptional regulator [Steroidobacteraceae bacterium]
MSVLEKSASSASAAGTFERVATGCPLTAALNAIGGKWSLICLYWLEGGVRRFNELRRLIPEVSHKVLAETLRNLEREGLVCRTVRPAAVSHVEYGISAHGQSVLPILHAVRLWGHQQLDRRASPDANGGTPDVTGETCAID